MSKTADFKDFLVGAGGTPVSQMIRTTSRTTLSFGANDTSKNFIFNCPGILFAILYEQYDTTNNVTGTVTIVNANSITLFSKSSLADNANSLISVRLGENKDVPLMNETHTCKVTLSGTPGNAGNIYVTIYVV